MNKNDVNCKYKRWISFFCGSRKCERNVFRAKLTWRPTSLTFARDPLRSYFHEPQKNEIYFVNVESYIWFDIPYELRKLPANFKCSGNNLMIEKGRHDSVDAQFRFLDQTTKINFLVL